MPPLRRQRACRGASVVLPPAAARQRPIQQYARVSKPVQSIPGEKGTQPRALHLADEERKEEGKEKEDGVQKDVPVQLTPQRQRQQVQNVNRPKKRQREDEDEDETRLCSAEVASSEGAPRTPRNKRYRLHTALSDSLPTPAPTPTRATANLFDQLRIASSPPTPSSSSSSSSSASDEAGLPEALHDYTELHGAFITALALHFAHYGLSTPADLSALCPSISLGWRRRDVTILDVRRLLALQSHTEEDRLSSSGVQMSDYGRGKVCVELRLSERAPGRTLSAGFITDIGRAGLAARFERGLHQAWSRWTTRARGEASTDDFLDHLPLAAISLCESLTQARNLSANSVQTGRQRLQDLQAESAKGRLKERQKLKPYAEAGARAAAAPPTSAATPPPRDAASRAQSLLDRVLGRQREQQTRASTALSPAGLARRAAAQRAQEIVDFLGLVAASKAAGFGRASFPLTALIISVQTSLRSPISADEVVACLDLLQSEVTPGFVQTIDAAGLRIIVVKPALRPSEQVMQERIHAALGN